MCLLFDYISTFSCNSYQNGSIIDDVGGNNMKVSSKGRYALRIMIDLAMNDNGNFISLKEIAERNGMSMKYSEQIVSMLNKAGYLQTARGNNGGYKLNRKPEEYKVGDILRASEGDLAPIMCLEEDGVCTRKENCITYSFWEGL